MVPVTPSFGGALHGGARFLLHSHDSYGLGHLRRTLAIATTLARRFPDAQVLVTTGSSCATRFALEAGVEVIKLPSVTKGLDGTGVARSLRGSLGEITSLRSRILRETFRAFEPHVLLVDHRPLGLGHELLDVLREARDAGTHTVLGLRDIIDEPLAVAREWGDAAVHEALTTLFDLVLVYGSPRVFDPRTEYAVPPEVARSMEFTGYIVSERPQRRVRPLPALRRHVLVATGGGEDGGGRIASYLDALELEPADWDSTLVLGPMLDPAEAHALRHRARLLPRVQVHTFHPDLPRLMADADALVGMAGYNLVAEALQARIPTLLLPRSFPRREQELRAERLERLGLARCLIDPTPHALRAAIERELETPRQPRWTPPLQGREHVARAFEELLAPDLMPEPPPALPGTRTKQEVLP